ncbi:MAG: hypothetical protein NT026_00990, partial [Candidatus Staskawiczbacteria bacterium]|nr:hypothetical protein [Candidatus Staskawiczbacteria bacterium]
MPRKKIIIISMTAGTGHIMAAKSILDYILSYTDAKAEHIDFSKIINPAARFVYQHFYETAAKHVPWLWGWYYNITNFNRFIFFLCDKLVSLDTRVDKKIIKSLREEEPDIVVFTNPVPARILSKKIKNMFGDKCKIAIVSTDYQLHRVYNIPEIDYYFASCGEVKYELMELGADKEKIFVSGIPVNPRFFISQDIAELKNKYKLNNGLPVVVFVTSSLKKQIVF